MVLFDPEGTIVIRLTRLADYAVLLMSHLAERPEHVFNAAELAAASSLPAPTVRKILGLMSRGGLLLSHRGQAGGFSLAREAAHITVGDIVCLVDGPVALTECIQDRPGHCDLEARCRVRGYWQKINGAVQRALTEVSLADLACPALALPIADTAPAPVLSGAR